MSDKNGDGEFRVHFEISTIETIDKSVLNFVESLNLSTNTNKGFKPVPVVWGTAERSFQSKRGREIRDSQGLLVLPIISIRRASFEKNLQSPGVFQGYVPESQDEQGGSLGVRRTIFQEKTIKFANADSQRLNNGQKNSTPTSLANKKVVYKTVSVPMPVNIEAMYEITIRTEYQQQMNDLMTPFITKPGTINYVSLREGDHRYEGFIQSDYSSNDNLSDFSQDERRFETKINFKVIGYVISEGPNREKPYYAVKENAVEIKMPRERISLAEIPEHEYGSYYGLSGVPLDRIAEILSNPHILNNIPAASFFAGGGSGGTNVSSNVVTTENFKQVMSDNMSIREVLKNEEVVPENLKRFTTTSNIKANTELVMYNGVLQPFGTAEAGGTYTIENSNTVVFNEDVENSSLIVITYIKG